MKKIVVFLMVVGLVLSVGTANSTELMPDFAGIPTGWVTDRYEPASFSNVGTFQGRDNVLGIGISSAEGFDSRPSAYQYTFYNTQGRQSTIAGGAGSTLSADLWIDQSWSNSGTVRTDMWGVMTDGSEITNYPIIGFTNYGGARLRVWDNAGWHDLSNSVTYGAWTSFSLLFTGNTLEYFVNGTSVYTDDSITTTTGFSGVIMQAYNFYGDPSITGADPINYKANWSNKQAVPEPASMLLLGLGLLGLAGVRRKLKK